MRHSFQFAGRVAARSCFCTPWIVAALVAASSALAQAPKIIILESDGQVAVRGQIGNDSSFRRTFQIRLDGGETARVRFLASDLVTKTGQLIDRRQVSVTGDALSTPPGCRSSSLL
jgi:hypothetical protein